MQKNNVSRILLIVILLIFLLNEIISTANLIEDGALLRSVIPAVSWSIGVIIWVVYFLRKDKEET